MKPVAIDKDASTMYVGVGKRAIVDRAMLNCYNNPVTTYEGSNERDLGSNPRVPHQFKEIRDSFGLK